VKRLGLVVGVLAIALVASVAVRVTFDGKEPVVVVHWANGHPMRDSLLPEMAERFNKEKHETSDGRPIEVVVVKCDSSDQAADLVERVGGPESDAECQESGLAADNPTIVTPQSDDWLVDINHNAERDVVDLEADAIAETWLGIVTFEGMADCLREEAGPNDALGYAEVMNVVEKGWSAYPACVDEASTDWGKHPNLVFTNPNTSTSGRNVLASLYSIFAEVPPDQLGLDDIHRREVVSEVQRFQGLVDHYMPGTLDVNTKIVQGPEFGAFFLMPEDNLANLIMGKETALVDGVEEEVGKPDDELVMIYPEEGSVLNSNPAAIVAAGWVSPEQTAAARDWIGYLRDDEQQQAFMAAGFRPAAGTELEVDQDKFEEWGLEAKRPTSTIEPGGLKPEVLEGIIESWGSVKKPAIITFVVDTSGSMENPWGPHGESRIAQVQRGMLEVIDAIAGPDSAGRNSQVGLVAFAGPESIRILTEPGLLRDVRLELGDEIKNLKTESTGTALYSAVQAAVQLTAAAPGEPDTTRAVVVLSDGEANAGLCLHELVEMSSRSPEAEVGSYCAMVGDDNMPKDTPKDVNGNEVSPEDVAGDRLVEPATRGVQVFFLGFGEADIDVGGILANATGAEYLLGSDEEDLAALIEALSGYF
jgi:Ca-activated chloride channel family protein